MVSVYNISKQENKYPSHLIIPDTHTYPGENLQRFEWLSNCIMTRKPNVIVFLGDHWDMGSLCEYDKGKKDYVFKSIKQDIEWGHLASQIIFKDLIKYNQRRISNKKKTYNPLVIRLLGNHEYRLHKLLETDSKLEGILSMDMFKTRIPIREKIIDFQDFTIVDGVSYSHYFVSGVMGRPFSTANLILTKRAMSCTMGHNHGLSVASITKPTGEHLRAVIGGTFQDPLTKGFGGPQVDNIYWNGLLFKHGVHDGDYDLEEIGIQRLEREYG